MTEVTRILSQIDDGDPLAAQQLLPLVYDELRMLAARKLARETPGQTLQATALVHEAFLRVIGGEQEHKGWDHRGHFFAAAAEAMRRIVIEIARKKRGPTAGGNLDRQELTDIALSDETAGLDLLALDDALRKLETQRPRRAEVVKLRYFAGLTIQQTAEALGIAVSTANSDWAYARAWLRLELSGESERRQD